MRLLLSSLLLLAFTMGVAAQQNDSEEDWGEKNVLKVNTLSLMIGTGSMFYERKITEKMSGQMGLGYLNYGLGDNARFTGLFLTPEVRFYPRGTAIDGFYFAPYVRYQRFDYKDDDTKGNYTNTGGGFLMGRQWIKSSGFTMDFFFGGHYGVGKVSNDTDDVNTDLFEGFRMRFGFAIGFGF